MLGTADSQVRDAAPPPRGTGAGCSARADRAESSRQGPIPHRPRQAGPAASTSPVQQHIPGEEEQGLKAPELKYSPVGGWGGVTAQMGLIRAISTQGP